MHGNCSGKHAGMLAVCVHEGCATVGYREVGHPLQRRIVELVAEVCGLEDDEILVAGDNRGVPTFAIPLRNFATGLARIATGEGCQTISWRRPPSPGCDARLPVHGRGNRTV